MDTIASGGLWWPFGVPPPGPLGRLFCLPYAGAGASAYATWHRHAPPGLAVVATQLPGREQRLKEPAEPNLHRLIDKLAPAIEPFTWERYSLFGHSMGALIVFEMPGEMELRPPGWISRKRLGQGGRQPTAVIFARAGS